MYSGYKKQSSANVQWLEEGVWCSRLVQMFSGWRKVCGGPGGKYSHWRKVCEGVAKGAITVVQSSAG